MRGLHRTFHPNILYRRPVRPGEQAAIGMLDPVGTGEVDCDAVPLTVEGAAVCDIVARVRSYAYGQLVACKDDIFLKVCINRRIPADDGGELVEVFCGIDDIPSICILRRSSQRLDLHSGSGGI